MPASAGFLAVDIGGTKLEVGVVSDDGEVLVRRRAATPRSQVWSTLSELTAAVLADSPVAPRAVGVGTGGPMTPEGETVSPLHIPDWRGFPLRARLAEATGLPVFVANDAQAIVLGETWRGALAGESDALGMVVSTGVGGGVVSGGRLVTGRLGNAGHVGHVVVAPEGRRCACGTIGCLEAQVSGLAIEASTGRPASEAPTELRRECGRLVGVAVAAVAVLFDLRRVVIGGSVALGFGEPFFESAEAEARRCANLEFARDLTVRPVGLGADAPLVGAAAVARERLAFGP